MEAISAQAPEPENAYAYVKVKQLSDAMEAFVETINPELDYPTFEIPEGQDKVPGKLPPEVFVSYVKIVAFLMQLEEAKQYNLIAPEDLLSDTALGVAAQNFSKMESDKKLISKLGEGGEEAPPEEAPPQQKAGEYSEEDKRLMEMK